MAKTELHDLKSVQTMISEGKVLLLAGDESLLKQLPSGQWIGGTSANFMTSDGGKETSDEIFVTDISSLVSSVTLKTYTESELPSFPKDYSASGFSLLIIPGMSAIHSRFAQDVQNYDGVFNAPLAGWISGVHVSEIGKSQPKVFAGNPTPLDNQAVAVHATLPSGKAAKIDIINLFTQGSRDEICFPESGFSTTGTCTINGKTANLAAYLVENAIDTQLPLVADYNGAMINVSIQSVDKDKGVVQFYAPVFSGVTYKIAKPVPDYTTAFKERLEAEAIGDVAFSCNCILNFLYAKLQDKKTGHIVGPITFGEIGYILLNQTLVYMTIQDV